MGVIKKIVKKYKKVRYGNNYVLGNYKNLSLLLRASNHVDRKMLGGSSYEEEQINKVIKQINSKNIDYFVDIGANIGIYSLRIAKECGGLDKVIAIEAQIENFNQLCGNIRLNNLDRIINALNVGVSDKTGEIGFLANKGSSTGTSRIKETAPSGTSLRKFNSELIRVDKIDNILSYVAQKSIFFKIDVEGHERNVLLGMKEVIKRNHCFFQIEILDNDVERIVDDFGFTKTDRVGCDVYFESGSTSSAA